MADDNEVVGYIKFIDPVFFDKLTEGQIHLVPATIFNDHGEVGIRDEYEGKTGDGVGYKETLALADVPSKNSVIYTASFVTITEDLFDDQGILKGEVAEAIQASANTEKRPFVIFPKARFQRYIHNEYNHLIRKWYTSSGMVHGASTPTANFVIAPRLDESIVFESLSTRSVRYSYDEMLSNGSDAETLAVKQFATKLEKYSDQREFRILLNVFYNEELADEEKKKGIDIFLRNNAYINEENTAPEKTRVC